MRRQKVLVVVDGRFEHLLLELAGWVRAARLQTLAAAPVAMRYKRPVCRRWGYDYWQQLPDGRIALGGVHDAGDLAEWTEMKPPRLFSSGSNNFYTSKASGSPTSIVGQPP